MSFADLGLGADVLQGVTDAGYDTPTPIQRMAIPPVLMGRDILGCAQTGTGKTASFTLPMLDILHHGRARARMPRSIILEPTRELAAQVTGNFDTYGKHTKLSKALLIGGSSFSEQEKILDKGADVLICTPGRMIDQFERGKLILSDVSILVIDEADRMLDMGFIPDIERIVAMLPAKRQTLMFSATMPKEIRKLADRFLNDPKEISVAPPSSLAATVDHKLAVVAETDKRRALRELIRAETVRNAFIFCNRKRDVDILYKSLSKHGFNAGRLHGDMDQSVRNETLDRFKSGDITLLVCSDVAARGIDIADVSHVFNFDVPFNPEDYVHRSGRTGRAGREGKAFTLAAPEDGKLVAAIGKTINKEIPVLELSETDNLELDFSERSPRRRSGSGARPAKSENTTPNKRTTRRARHERYTPSPATPDTTDPAFAEQPDTPPLPPKRGNRQEAGEPIIGFGDLTPAFVLRPVPKRLSRRIPEREPDDALV